MYLSHVSVTSLLIAVLYDKFIDFYFECLIKIVSTSKNLYWRNHGCTLFVKNYMLFAWVFLMSYARSWGYHTLLHASSCNKAYVAFFLHRVYNSLCLVGFLGGFNWNWYWFCRGLFCFVCRVQRHSHALLTLLLLCRKDPVFLSVFFLPLAGGPLLLI
jgi:hypothetical protein